MSTTAPITVAHVVQNLDIGGLERVVINLITHADPNRYRHILCCLGDGGSLSDELKSQGHRVYALRKRPGLDYFLLFRLARLFRRERVGIVHSHNFAPLVYGSIAGRLSGASGVIYTAHGARTSKKKRQSWFQRLRLVDHLVFVSDDARRVALDSGAVVDRNVSTILNGIDLERYQTKNAARPDALREELGIPPGASVIGIVARLTAAKDHRNLLRGFVRVLETHTDTRLLVVGDGELRHDLEQEAARLNVADHTHFVGARSDVPELLGLMDVYVLSSYTEGLAITLLEAMAAALPIVATRVGGNHEVVIDGQTGIIVPPSDPSALGDAVVDLLSDRKKAAGMGKMGRERAAEHFGIEAMMRRYHTLYETVAAR